MSHQPPTVVAPDPVAALLTERAELQARVTELEGLLADERARHGTTTTPGWRAPGW